jgi:hypothetical protein
MWARANNYLDDGIGKREKGAKEAQQEQQEQEKLW